MLNIFKLNIKKEEGHISDDDVSINNIHSMLSQIEQQQTIIAQKFTF